MRNAFIVWKAPTRWRFKTFDQRCRQIQSIMKRKKENSKIFMKIVFNDSSELRPKPLKISLGQCKRTSPRSLRRKLYRSLRTKKRSRLWKQRIARLYRICKKRFNCSMKIRFKKRMIWRSCTKIESIALKSCTKQQSRSFDRSWRTAWERTVIRKVRFESNTLQNWSLWAIKRKK